jgi:hypothetical protein
MTADYAKLEAHILALLGREALSEAEFGACALEIYRFQREHNQPYDNYCRHIGAPENLDDWKKIPALPQSAFKQNALRCFSAEQTAKTFRTSGTTGEGFGEHHFFSTQLYDAAILRGWDFFELPRLPQIILTPSPAQASHSSLSHMMGVLHARAANGAQHFCIGDSGVLEVEKIRALIRDATSPLLLMGTALAFLNLFEKCEPLALPSGSFALETGGYKGSGRELTKTELYEMFGAHLDLAPESVINEYGMTELSSQFYTRGLGRPHESPPWLKSLVIDPETGDEVSLGEIGALRMFDLANLGSVMAVQTRDLAIRREHGFELLGRDPAALPRGCSRSVDEMLSRP